jgi:DNA-binding PadR family transcriptional regulator
MCRDLEILCLRVRETRSAAFLCAKGVGWREERLMTIRFAVLGLLAEAPLHGYAVHALLEKRLGDFLDLHYGQIYQVLRVLERQGLVLASEARVGRRPLRKVYAITKAGREALSRWLRGEGARRRPLRDELYVRLYLSALRQPDQVGRLVANELAAARAEREELASRRTRLASAASPEELVRLLLVEAALFHAEATTRALEATREAIARLGVAAGPYPPSQGRRPVDEKGAPASSPRRLPERAARGAATASRPASAG